MSLQYDKNLFIQWWTKYFEMKEEFYDHYPNFEEFQATSICREIMEICDALPYKSHMKNDGQLGEELVSILDKFSDAAEDAYLKYYEEGTEDEAFQVCYDFLEEMKDVEAKVKKISSQIIAEETENGLQDILGEGDD